ncbi:RING-H2 finger protein ATL80-like [Hibiscus syriacus]|uniref:RING-H2 finger protein ATL80-like n=1 Tax=Hibiscus syriacus TaxID=106335 RepID=UPI001922C578|nr:RING-H2 finger protein ATL80-like [Hibiscus syriacus]
MLSGPGTDLITTVIGFGMSATFIVFVCTRMICRRIRASRTRHLMFQAQSSVDIEQPEPQMRGLEPVVIAAMPTVKFTREAFSSMEDAQCCICLGEYEEKEVLRMLPKCGHDFHLTCIDVWLKKQSSCPICRLPLHDPPEFNTAQSDT